MGLDPLVITASHTRQAVNGMVSSDDHLATAAGVAMLVAGGSAADAALAANAVLAVTAPHACGLGGDLLALVHHGGVAPVALLAVGRSGSGADPDQLRADGVTAMPTHGDVRSVTVPGCVDGWFALHRRFGRLELDRVLAPAIRLASGGFPASRELSAAATLLPDGALVGERIGATTSSLGLLRRIGLARQLEVIADKGRAGFYDGEFGAGLIELAAGELTAEDLRRSHVDWVDAISTRAWGAELWGPPPVSQAYVGLSAWWMTEGLPLPDDPGDPRWPHLLIEAVRQSAFDRLDVLHEGADPASLLGGARLGSRRAHIDVDRAADLVDRPTEGSTTYLCAADGDGMAVSLIQSNAAAFGSHLLVPGTDVFLQNRGIGFSLDPGHPAEYGPGRRPPHTLAPFLVTDDRGGLRAVLGTRGADAQPQVALQLLARLVIGAASPGAAVGAGRWIVASPGGTGFQTWSDRGSGVVKLEAHAPPSWEAGLRSRGHEVVVAGAGDPTFGFAHVITAETGLLVGAADPRSMVGSVSGC
jgi:gamma-glutamyltranspeptidase / glutathione hydrolase